jgi:hypothetical protein
VTDSTPSRPGVKQGGSGGNYELYLDLFGGEVLTAFETQVIMRDKHMVKTLEKGKSFRFPAIWRTTAAYHTPGAEILGNQIPHTEVVINPDDKLISHVFVADIDEILSHYEFRAPYAAELGTALARHYDANVIRRIIQASRQGALFTGDVGGSALTNASYATSATALFDGLSDARLTMEQKDVPVDAQPLYALFKPLQFSLMARADRNLSRDYNGGDQNIRSIQKAFRTYDDVNVVKSNLTPYGVNDSANSAIPSKYRADFTNTIGAVWTPMAAATAEVQGLSSQVVDQPQKQGTLLISRMMVGTDPLRSKCAVELKTA